MPAFFLKGDLFHHENLQAFAHGCNCAGAMGKGIAIEFRSRLPRMYDEYKKRCTEGRFTLGDVFTWTEGNQTVFNLGTQKTWKTKADLLAVETAVRRMVHIAEQNGIKRVGLPRIGAGLGGLPWEQVRSLIEHIGEETGVELVIFEEFVPAD
jgi:O-acetyl-ADP-ribose deacetylase (regulator of RNase III)